MAFNKRTTVRITSRGILAIGLALILAVLAVVSLAGQDSEPAEAAISGTGTISDSIGITRQQLVSHLEAHENDGYYLGTPYLGSGGNTTSLGISTWWSNGHPGPGGLTGMNCTGFVLRAIQDAGGNLDGLWAWRNKWPRGKRAVDGYYPYPGAHNIDDDKHTLNDLVWFSSWVYANYHGSIKGGETGYSSVQEMINGGIKKGDIILAFPQMIRRGTMTHQESAGQVVWTMDSNDVDYNIAAYPNQTSDCHILIYWGDGTSDVAWHASSHANGVIKGGAGNFISQVTPKTEPSHYWVIPLADNGKGRIEKASTNTPVSTDGNPNYTMAGIQYGLYGSEATARADTHRIATLTLGADGKSEETPPLPGGTYYVREVANPANTGYKTDRNVHAVPIQVGTTLAWGSAFGIADNPVYGYVKIKKYSKNTGQLVGKPGFKYELHDASNAVVGYATTDNTGTAYFTGSGGGGAKPLALGTYTVKEVYAPAPYFRDAEWTGTVTLARAGENGDIAQGHKGVETGTANTIDVDASNYQWGYIQVTKRSESTDAANFDSVERPKFRYALYKTNKIARQPIGGPIAYAVTKNNGKAFFTPNQDGSGDPSQLHVTMPGEPNEADGSTQGYYLIEEIGTVEPYYEDRDGSMLNPSGSQGNKRYHLVRLSPVDNVGTLRAGNRQAPFAQPLVLAGINNTVNSDVYNRQWGYVQITKRNTATAGTITSNSFKFKIYKRGANPATDVPLGIAVTNSSNGGVATFMWPNADNETPSNKPRDLPVINKLRSDEGYYDIYEASVTEPFFTCGEKISVTLHASGNKGASSSDIVAPGNAGTTFGDNGQPHTDNNRTINHAGIKVIPDNTASASDWDNRNTNPTVYADDSYGFINIVKKNMETGIDGATVNMPDFEFTLFNNYDDASALNMGAAVETVATDANGQVTFHTKLPLKGSARNKPTGPNADATRKRIASPTNGQDISDRCDGLYYVRETKTVMPYNINNTIYEVLLEPVGGMTAAQQTGHNGEMQATVRAKTDTARNSPYTGDWHTILTTRTTGSATFPIHGEQNPGSGTNIKNVMTLPEEDAPRYGRLRIYKVDSQDKTPQRGAEYQIYASKNVTYRGAGGNYVGNGKPGNQRTPTAGYDGVDAKSPSGYTKNLTDDVNNPSMVPLRRVTEQDVCKQVTIPAGGVTYQTGADGNVATTVTHPIVFTRPDGSSYDTIVTDENGEATSGWLPIDETGEVTYYVVEVKTSNGRILGNPTLDPSVPNSGIKAYTLKYDGTLKNEGATLVDRQVIVAGAETANVHDGRNNDKVVQEDDWNTFKFYKKTKKSETHGEGDPVEGATLAFWKQADDIGQNQNSTSETPTRVKSDNPSDPYTYDSIVIRTSNNQTLVPRVHQRVIGGEMRLNNLPEGYTLELRDPEKEEADPITIDQVPFTQHIYRDLAISIKDAEGNPVGFAGDSHVRFTEGNRVEITVNQGVLGGLTISQDSFPIQYRAADISYSADRDAWVATNLKNGAIYEVEFNRQIVKVIDTSGPGGHVWYGRYSDGTLSAGHEAEWFNNGWLDQGAMPNHDSKIILHNHMWHQQKADADGQHGLFTTNAVRTQDHQSWLQDTSNDVTEHDAAGYYYETVTDKEGSITLHRIGSGNYVLAEIKPPVDEVHHTTYLVDTSIHHFIVDETTGSIHDTDEHYETPEATEENPDPQPVPKVDKYAIEKNFDFTDDVTKMKISKKEMADGDEVIGATLILTAANGDVIREWVSAEEPEYIENLVPGRYTLTETIGPKTYEKSESVTFNLLPDGSIQKFAMLDAPISIDAQVDKRQEIANPLEPADEANGDGKNRAQAQENRLGHYAYALDFRSTSNTWTDEFTVEDPLEPVRDGYANLVSIVTPQAFQDYDGKLNVWYKTNKTSPGYRDLKGGEAARKQNMRTDATAFNNDEYRIDWGDTVIASKDTDTIATTPSEDFSANNNDNNATESDDTNTSEPEETAMSGDDGGTKKRPYAQYLANATLTDNHENPWLYDDKAMTADKDGDCRIISYDGWKLWEADIDAIAAKQLYVRDLQLGKDEMVTAVRFEYGRVEVGFTSNPDNWAREYLKDEHDDVEHVQGLNGSSFQAAETSADSAIARMDILANRFTTEAAIDLRGRVASTMTSNLEEYDKLVQDYEDHNLTAAQKGLLTKFIQAKTVPANVGKEGADLDRLRDGTFATKSSLTSAFMICTTPEGREVLRNVVGEYAPDWQFEGYVEDMSLMAMARETLVNVATDAIPELENIVPEATIDRIRAAIERYDTELKRVPDAIAGEDHDAALAELLASFLQAVDDIGSYGVSGRVLYAPAIMRMQLTSTYRRGCSMVNTARVDAYRNGGNDDTREPREDGKENLEGHDQDKVVQTPGVREARIGTTLKTADGEKIIESDGSDNIPLVDTVEYHGLVPGVEYEMRGELHLKGKEESGNIVDRGVVTGSFGTTSFIPETPDGTVDVTLVLPAKEILFEPVVAYEELRAIDEATGVASDVIVAEHKDIADTGQSVDVAHEAEDFIGAGANPLIQTGGTIAAGVVVIGAITGVVVWRIRKAKKNA